MPMAFKTALQNYHPMLEAGQPIGTVITIGAGQYIEVCPCCSCLHSLPAGTVDGALFSPPCTQGRKTAEYAPTRAVWVRQHPAAASFRTVKLRQAAEILAGQAAA